MKTVRLLLMSLGMLVFGNNALAIDLIDISDNWRFRENLISAFPKTYDLIPKEENANIIRIFRYFQGDASNPLNERRVEVFYTGGDWMEFGYTYLVANSPNGANGVYADSAGAYFIPDLSTTDREEGSTPPAIDPLDPEALKCFIRDQFLNELGDVKGEFKPLARPNP
jgi:hypothetical protein